MIGASARVVSDPLLDSLQVSSFKVKLRLTVNECAKDFSPPRPLLQARFQAPVPGALLVSAGALALRPVLQALAQAVPGVALDFLSSPWRLLLSPESAGSGHSRPLWVAFLAEAAEALPGPADVPSRRRAAQQLLLLLVPQVRTAALLQPDRVTFVFCRASTTRATSVSESLATP